MRSRALHLGGVLLYTYLPLPNASKLTRRFDKKTVFSHATFFRMGRARRVIECLQTAHRTDSRLAFVDRQERNMNAELSRVQQRTLAAIEQLTAKHGYPPTVGELADKLKRTKASAHGSLDRLIKAGFIRRTQGKARSIEVVRMPMTSVINLVPDPCWAVFQPEFRSVRTNPSAGTSTCNRKLSATC
jgi:DNA-binding MarR family transcriptional regulator